MKKDSKDSKKQNDYLKAQDARHLLMDELLHNIQANLPKLEAALLGLDEAAIKGVKKSKEQMGTYEDLMYRFYHFSFKVYRLQENTTTVIKLLAELDPKEDKSFCSFFEEIMLSSISVGSWKHEHNKQWTKHTRPIVEAFFHAKYFLAMAVKYGTMFRNRKKAPHLLPSGWAALLTLYKLR